MDADLRRHDDTIDHAHFQTIRLILGVALNVTVEAHRFVGNEAFNGEPCWETVDRLLGELAIRRAMAGVPTSEPQENSDGWEG